MFDDGTGDPVTVYIRKLNPVDQETAFRRANAARARSLIAARDPDSDEATAFLGQAMDVGGRDELISFLNASKIATFRETKEAEIGDDEEWKKDDYLQGLYDAWNDGLDQVHALNDADDPTFADAVRVFSEMQRFSEQVDELVRDEDDRLKESFSSTSLAELQETVADELVVLNGDSIWVREYRRCQVWLCTRTPEDHGKRYFGSREEVNELPGEVYGRLVEELTTLTVEVPEGKDLPLADSSLPLSESLEQEVIIPSSGPQSVVL